MKQLLFILIMFCHFLLLGQQLGNNSFYTVDSDTSSVLLNLSSDGYYSSSIFNNKMLNTFINGGFIDKQMKDKALSKAKDKNTLGGEFNTSVYYSNTKQHLYKDWGYYLGLSYNYSVGAQFTRDAYQLLFYGNKPLENEVGILSPTFFFLRDVNTFSFGINKNNEIKIGATLLSFNNNTGAEISRGSFYTGNNGSSLELDVLGYYYGVDTNKTVQLLANNAMGIGIDFEYSIPLRDSGITPLIVLGVRNVGFLKQKNTYQVSSKTKYTYNGIEINSLANIGEGLITSGEIVDSLGVKTITEDRTTMLPFEVYFFQVPSYKKQLEVIYGFRFKNQSAYKAFIYAGANVKLNELFYASTYLSHGGYANFQWGVSSQLRMKKTYVGVNTNNLLGFFSNKAYGKSLGISLTYQL